MVIRTNKVDERHTRIETQAAEYREAQRRSLVKQGIALWTATENAARTAAGLAAPRRTTRN